MKKKIGLFFGSFDPIHIGHKLICQFFLNFSDINEIWIVVTPQNPFKTESKLSSDRDRYNMVKLAVKDIEYVEVSDVEFHIKQPNYTHVTLEKLKDIYDDEYEFILILGEDNYDNFDRWKNYRQILDNYKIYIYPRIYDGRKELKKTNKNFYFFKEAPIFEISSTFLRNSIKTNKNVNFLMDDEVVKYINNKKLYI